MTRLTRLTRSIRRAAAWLFEGWTAMVTVRGPHGVVAGCFAPSWTFPLCWLAPVPGEAEPEPGAPAPSPPPADSPVTGLDLAGPPPGHPERLCPLVPPNPVERQLWHQLRPAPPPRGAGADASPPDPAGDGRDHRGQRRRMGRSTR